MAAPAIGLSRAAKTRLRVFTALAWVMGLFLFLFTAFTLEEDGGFEVDGLPGSDDAYAYEPWLREEPILATDLGDGRFEGPDGAMIPLSGLDPTKPLLVRELDGGYVFDVRLTGPGGVVLAEGEYGDPPRFSSLHDDAIVVIVPQPDVELWINGSSDEQWRVEIEVGDIPAVEDAEMAGFEQGSFLIDSGATTARLTARGQGTVLVHVTTVHGSDTILDADSPVDRSIAWPDAELVHFAVETWGDAGWRLEIAGGA